MKNQEQIDEIASSLFAILAIISWIILFGLGIFYVGTLIINHYNPPKIEKSHIEANCDSWIYGIYYHTSTNTIEDLRWALKESQDKVECYERAIDVFNN